MNKKIIFSTILIVLMIMLLPTTTALQEKKEISPITKPPTFKELQQMTTNELIDYINQITDQNPELQEQINQNIKKIENTQNLQNLDKTADNNQTLIQKIWNQVLNYRLFRLYISFWVLVYTQSNLALMRTLHWAIKTLKWIQIGIILGIIDIPDYVPPETPTILFAMDHENNTLTVTAISTENILWNDIDHIGSGHSDPLPTGNITIGDMITNCTGIIILRYKPTDAILGVYEFE